MRSLVRNAATKQGGIATALLYTRVSSFEQEHDGLSLPSQLTECRRYAQYHGLVIGAEYTDTMSGKRDDRPGYRDLLAEARQRRDQGQAVGVAVKWLHRFGRRELERARAWAELDRPGVQVHFLADGGTARPLI